MKVAVIADLHLPDDPGTVKEDILHWTISAAVSCKAELIAGAGDLTALGTVSAARRIVQNLQDSKLPYILAPGNAELRTPAETAQVMQILTTNNRCGAVVTVDSANGKLSMESSRFLHELAASSQRNLLLITHCPPAAWEKIDQESLDMLIDRRIISHVVYGHKHIDRYDEKFSCIRGLDPDKASGGPPALVFFEQTADGSWHREDLPCPDADVAGFPESVREKFLDSLGISGMRTLEHNLELATIQKLPVFEIRFSAEDDFPSDKLCRAMEIWRQNGGKYLSMHLVDLRFDGRDFSGMEMLKTAARSAVKLGCDGVTFHVPRGFSDELTKQENINTAAKITSACLQTLFDHDVTVGVENLHTDPAEREEKRYKFGCTPDECMLFINALRALNPGKKIGLHLDIGHAANNAPFNNKFPLSSWYAAYGREIVAMHIHQVAEDENGKPVNHTGFNCFYGRRLSLASLAMARRQGQIGKVPMILELRCPAEPSLEVLRKILMK